MNLQRSIREIAQREEREPHSHPTTTPNFTAADFDSYPALVSLVVFVLTQIAKQLVCRSRLFRIVQTKFGKHWIENIVLLIIYSDSKLLCSNRKCAAGRFVLHLRPLCWSELFVICCPTVPPRKQRKGKWQTIGFLCSFVNTAAGNLIFPIRKVVPVSAPQVKMRDSHDTKLFLPCDRGIASFSWSFFVYVAHVSSTEESWRFIDFLLAGYRGRTWVCINVWFLNRMDVEKYFHYRLQCFCYYDMYYSRYK